MSDVSKLNFGDNGGDRDVKDSVAREKLTVVDPSAGSGLIQFGVDANGNYGYKKVGADTVIPFKTGDASEGEIIYKSYGYEGSSSSVSMKTSPTTSSYSHPKLPRGKYVFIFATSTSMPAFALFKNQYSNSQYDITVLERSGMTNGGLRIHTITIELNEEIAQSAAFYPSSSNTSFSAIYYFIYYLIRLS